MPRGRAVAARKAHNLEDAGSNPAPATNKLTGLDMLHLWRDRNIRFMYWKIAMGNGMSGKRITSGDG